MVATTGLEDGNLPFHILPIYDIALCPETRNEVVEGFNRRVPLNHKIHIPNRVKGGPRVGGVD